MQQPIGIPGQAQHVLLILRHPIAACEGFCCCRGFRTRHCRNNIPSDRCACCSAWPPVPIIAMLNEVIDAGLTDPGIKQRFAELGGIPMPMSPVEFGKFVVEDTDRWSGVVRSINLTVQ